MLVSRRYKMISFISQLKNLIKPFRRTAVGFTALQTAIAMTASIVTAGTVASAVVTSGNEVSDQSQKAIYQTIQNLESTFMLKSTLAGKAAITGVHGTLGQIIFNVGLVLDTGSMDFTPPNPDPANTGLAAADSQNQIVISYSEANQRVDNLYWTVTKLGKNNGDNLLEGSELFQITVGSSSPGQNGGNLIDALSPDLSTNTAFTIEMLTSQTPVLAIDQTTPGSFTKVIILR
jgi:hypothetical protein